MTTNLSGSLGPLGLDEVLSMLAMGGRSAHMSVSSPTGTGEIQLAEGHVCAASADRTRAGLLRRVVAAADVHAADLAEALEAPDAVRALVDSGTVDRDLAHAVAVEHVIDALGEMLTWTEGAFEVSVGAEHDGDIGVRLPMDEALGRSRGRADEWTRIRGSLPEEQAVLVVAPSVPEGLSLGRDDWSVLARVDGRRTLGEVVAAAGCAPLTAHDRIADLMGRGLLRVHSEEMDRPDEVARILDSLEGRAEAGGPADQVAVLGLDAMRGLDQPLDASPIEAVATEPAVPTPRPADDAEVIPAPAVAVEMVEMTVPEPVVEMVEEIIPAPVVEAVEEIIPAPVVEAVGADVPEAVAVVEEAVPEPMLGVEEAVRIEEPVALSDEQPVVADADMAWSPWAQALGLGSPAPEGELVADPLAGPGIAEMMAGALDDTEDVPVPQAPVQAAAPSVPEPRTSVEAAWAVESLESPVPDSAPVEPAMETPGFEPAPQAAFEPAMETPGFEPLGTTPAFPPAGELTEPERPAAEPVPDPLAGGLLAQLMTGVRGL